MRYRIVGDSCVDYTRELKKDQRFSYVPLTLEVGKNIIIDDDQFDQKKFLELIASTTDCPKTACPSPEAFKKAMECEAEEVYVVTLSQHLSGSYQAAVIGKQMYEEEHGMDKKIHVFSSDSASAGQLAQCLFIRDLCEEGISFEEVVARTSDYIEHMGTYFVLETLDFLKKNGRLTGLQAFFATALNIKPVMGADHGVIMKLGQERGISKALKTMCKTAVQNAGNTSEKRLVITHCNCPQRAELVKEEMLKLGTYKEVVITDAMGVASLYAGDGGIVMAL